MEHTRHKKIHKFSGVCISILGRICGATNCRGHTKFRTSHCSWLNFIRHKMELFKIYFCLPIEDRAPQILVMGSILSRNESHKSLRVSHKSIWDDVNNFDLCLLPSWPMLLDRLGSFPHTSQIKTSSGLRAHTPLSIHNEFYNKGHGQGTVCG